MKLFSKLFFLPLLAIATLTSPAWADVSGVTATLGTATVNTASQYTVGFTTGAAGALAVSDTIRITLPANTTLPASFPGGAGGQVTVNGTTATATSAGQVLTITNPHYTAIGNNTAVTLVIATGANNIVNPSIPGAAYQLQANTSVETTNVSSGNYTITASGTALTVGAIAVSPATIGNPASYYIPCTTSADGALWAGNSQITVTFPAGTSVTAGALTGVLVNGTAAFSANGNYTTRTIVVVPGQNVNNSSPFSIYLPATTVRNPLFTGGNTLTAATSAQPAGTSSSYNTTTSSTAVTVGTVTPNPTTIGNYSQYTINFNTAADGALVWGQSTVTVTFPAGYTVANGAIAGVTIEGTAAVSATGNSASRTVTIVPGQNINGGATNRTIVIPSTGNAVRNPTTANTYVLTVATSAQPTAGDSGNITIGTSGTAVTVGTVTPSPSTVGQYAQYTVNFNTAANGALVGGVSTITLTFPAGYTIADGAIANVTVESLAATSATGNAGTRTITIVPSQDIAASYTDVTVIIPAAGSAIRNPNTSGNYTLTVATSVQPTAGTSGAIAIGGSSTAVHIDSVTPTSTIVNNPSGYNVQIDISADGGLVGGSGSITLTFPSDTVIANGAIAGVTVEGTAATSATGNSAARTIVVVPSTDIAGGATNLNIVIPSGTAIRNPSTAGSYTLTAQTTVQPVGTSPSYTMSLSATNVNIDSVTPNPAVVGNQSQYTIDFDVSANGYLLGGSSTITVTFPSDTLVTNGAIAGITVDGLAASSATGNSGARTIAIVPSQNLDGGTNNVTLVIPSAAVRNPTAAATTYTLTIATSTQPAGTSPQYSINKSSTAVTFGTVSVNPNTIGNQGAYTINFNTSSDGPLIANASTITLTFPAGSVIANGAIAGVTVEGVAAASATGDSGTRTITIIPANAISGSTSDVTVITPASAVRNPLTANNYQLSVMTSAQPSGNSPNYAIGLSSTQVNVTSVTANPNTIGNQGAYTINFNTSNDGALVGGISTITVTFPNDTLVANGAISGITVEGVAATSATGNSGSRTITITPANNISGGFTGVTLSIPAAAVQNPTTASTTYTLTVATSVQPVGTSPQYTIGLSSTTLSVGTVTPNPATIGNSAQYSIQFTTAANAALLAGHTITIVFPGTTAIRNGSLAGTVTVNGVAASSASGNSGTRTITVTLASGIAASTPVTVVIPNDSNNIRNPTSAGNYQLTVATTLQPNAGTSSLYAIGLSANPVVVVSVTPNPAVVGNYAAYTIDFNTSSDGALVGGTSTIIVSFPAGTVVADGAITGVTVEGVAADSATGNSAGRTVTIVPNQNINANSTNVTLFIPSAGSAIRNPTSAGNYQLQVATSAQPSGNSPQYTIGQSSITLAVNSVTPNPDTVGSEADYTISITTSADGPLFNGVSQIVVTFPAGTVVANGGLAGVTVNGVAASSANGNSATRTVTIVVGSNLPAGGTYPIVIPSTVLQNPTTAGNYTLTVSTSAQPAGSRQYAIDLGSALTVNNVALSPSSMVNTNAMYTVNITTDVVLRANTSAIFLIFPNSTAVPNGAISGITVNSNPALSATGDAANRVITIIPAFPENPGTFDVAITSAVIMNSSIPGTLPMNVSTTAQPSGSANFTITPANTTISTPNVNVNPSQAGVAAQYTIQFSVGAKGRLVAGNTITFNFPAGTIFPSPMPAGSITVNGIGNAGPITAAGTTITVPVPAGVSVANSGLVTVVFSGVNNPNLGAQTLQVQTDAEPVAVTSTPYYITANTHISTPAVTVAPATIYAAATYTITFTLGASGSLAPGADSIYIVFNNATTLPGTLNPAQITVRNGATSATVVSVSRLSAYALAITSPIEVLSGAANKTVSVEIQAGFGLINPGFPGAYTLSAYTSIENTSQTSDPYTINPSTSTQITAPQVDLFPGFTNSLGRYQIAFNVGSLGALAANVSTIRITFPPQFTLPASIPAADILVNNTALSAAPAIAGQTLTLTVPIAIPLSGPVSIVIQASARIRNPAVTGSYSLTLSTSSEPNLVNSNTFEIRQSTWADVVGYPNPLKYDTAVNKAFVFTLIPDRTATLRLYSLDGKLVRTITKDDDTDRMVWNLDNERGKLVASGIYIYVIKGASGEKRGKIGFLK